MADELTPKECEELVASLDDEMLAVHPGVYVTMELGERGWSQDHFAELTSLADSEVRAICDCRASVTPRSAAGLARGFGTSEVLWLNLQAGYDEEMNAPLRRALLTIGNLRAGLEAKEFEGVKLQPECRVASEEGG
jgi:plasmid maintenance system antidote protein VapI